MEQKQPTQQNTSTEVTPTIEREWLKQEKITYGALIAAGLIFIQPFLYGEQFHGMTAKITVLSFAIAIPILAALTLLNEEETFRKHPSKSKIAEIARVIGQDAAFLGFVAGFWHIDKMAGICVIVASIIGLTAHSAGYTRLYSPSRTRFKYKK